MSKHLLFVAIFFCLSLFTSCQKELSNQLKGKWQLKTIEDAGQIHQIDTVWYNFQSESLFMYQIYKPSNNTYLHRYGYKTQPDENVVYLELIQYKLDEFMPQTDWKNRIRSFKVERINHKELELSSEGKFYSFRKF